MSPKDKASMAPTANFMRSLCAGEILEDARFPFPDPEGAALPDDLRADA